MARKPASPTAEKPAAGAPPADSRKAVGDALFNLAAARPWDEIELGDIAGEAGVSLATLRNLFPSKLAILGGLHLPHRVGWRELIVGGLIAAMGFSVGLFFSSALFPPGQLRSEISMGVLLSLFGAPLALVAARLLRVGRFSQGRHYSA